MCKEGKMVEITDNGIKYRYRWDAEMKYLERVEKNSAIMYYRHRCEKKGQYIREYLPRDHKDEFEAVWKYVMKRTD